MLAEWAAAVQQIRLKAPAVARAPFTASRLASCRHSPAAAGGIAQSQLAIGSNCCDACALCRALAAPTQQRRLLRSETDVPAATVCWEPGRRRHRATAESRPPAS
jgi:hypothetical protein